MSEGKGQPDAAPSGGRTDSGIESISRNQAGQIVVKLAGRPDPILDARVVRCFPWSLPDNYVSVRDSNGKEVAMLKTFESLDPESTSVVVAELTDKVFNPKILRILDFKDEFGVTYIKAQTDRGEVTFQIRSRDDVRVLSSSRALFRDVDGNTYELTDLTALNAAGRRYLQRYF